MIDEQRHVPLISEGAADMPWRTSNLGALLFGATACFVRTKLRALHGSGFSDITEPQLALFHHLQPGGMRLTALSTQANLTKQSMIELVDRAVTMGLIERRADADDKRAKTVHLTASGDRLIESLCDAIVAAEHEVHAAFGAEFLLETRDRLHAYVAHRIALPAPGTNDLRFHNIGRLFAMAARQFSREALDVARTRGWETVSEVSLALFRNLDLQGSRLTDLAAAARVTKQSMREQVDRAEKLGLVQRTPDSRDRRAKMIVFTPRGLRMLGDVRGGLEIAETRFREQTGAAFAAALQERLRAYMRHPGENGARPYTRPSPPPGPSRRPAAADGRHMSARR